MKKYQMKKISNENRLMDCLRNTKIVVSGLVAIFVLVSFVSPAIAQESTDAVLIMHFDEGSGTVAKDESGCGNDGTIHGATWVDGISGKALSFDGVDDYVEVLTLEDPYTSDWTEEAWIKTTDLSAGVIMCKRHKESQESLTLHIGCWAGNNKKNNGLAYFSDDEANYEVGAVGTTNVADGKWHHLVGVRNGSNFYIYIDGDLESYNNINIGKFALNNIISTNNWHIGHSGAWKVYFNGTIDELRIYNYALTEDEIRAAAHSTDFDAIDLEDKTTKTEDETRVAVHSTDTVLIMHFDEGSGTIAKDESGCGNDGTIYGATWVDGISGKALSFDGVDDYVETSTVTNIPYSNNPFTITAWIYPRGVARGMITWWGIESAHQANGFRIIEPNEALSSCGANGGLLHFFWGKNPYDLFWCSPTPFKDNWYFVTATYDGTTRNIYVNGELKTFNTVITNVATPSYVRIGTRAALKEWFNGIIDEVEIYNRALSPEEIQVQYLAKRAGSSTEKSASALIDSVSNRIDTLKRNDVGTSLIEETLKNAQSAYDIGNYDEAYELVMSAQKMADDTYNVQQHVESSQSEIDNTNYINPEVSEAENKSNEEKSSGMPLLIVIFAIVGLLVLAYFIFKKSDGSGKEKDVREAGAIKSHLSNKEKQEEESSVLEDEDIAYETFCANCGVKITKKIFDKGKQLDSDTIICDGCYGTNQDFGGGCPVCKSDFSLFTNVSSQSVTGNLTVVCKKCGAIFDFKSDSIFSISKWKLIEGNSEYLNVALPEDDWKRIRNGEMPKNGVCPGCNYGVDVIWKGDAECNHCGRKLRIESNQLVEVVPDEIAPIPMYKVILYSKSVIWPPCCSICLGPAEEFKDRVDNFSTELIVYYYGVKIRLDF